MKAQDIKEDKSLWEKKHLEGLRKVLLVEESYQESPYPKKKIVRLDTIWAHFMVSNSQSINKPFLQLLRNTYWAYVNISRYYTITI